MSDAASTPRVAPFVQRLPLMRVILREGAVDALGAELALLRASRPLLVCSGSARRSATFARVQRQLEGLAVLAGDDVPPHSATDLVTGLAGRAAQHGVDCIVAFGGGSASDTAKAVAILLGEGGRLEDHAARFTPPATLHVPSLTKPKVPIVTIPCTASGAEVSAGLGVRTPEGHKLLFTDFQVASRVVLLDPVANLEVPAGVMLSTGMNGLAHCLEGLYSLERAPLGETMALDAMARFARALPAVRRDPQDVAARADLLYAAHLSGLVMINARTALHHAICHVIGSVTGVPHGEANAVMLPYALEFNRPVVAPALERAALALGAASADAVACIEAVRGLGRSLGVPQRLRDIGVPREALARIAEKAMGERGLYFNPRRVAGPHEILALLEQAY
ncbi:iron-containing alcohol dehydrogenase family protein [Ramlibacter sp. MAHUQ-53]|uniref:iron-containing alcohol dehydrogenase family protein n=1 Tax=unclassified Ramlibacter TaxID=2617605 RepID=UPI0036313E94